MIKFYGYAKCSTCRKAMKYLKENNVDFQDIDIVLNPPSKKILLSILRSGDYSIKELFNRSGKMYRELNMKEKMTSLSENQLLDLLAQNGKLIKRPIVVNENRYVVGFNEEKLSGIV